MSTIITVGNYKGGVGKTISSTMITYILSVLYDKKVLAVDTDQQGDFVDELEVSFKIEIDRSKNVYTACLGEEDVKDSIQTLTENLDILAGSQALKDFDNDVRKKWSKKGEAQYHDQILSLALEEVQENYDYIIIDTNPAIDLLTANVLTAANHVLIPTKTNARDKEKTMRYFNYLVDNYEEKEFTILGVLAYLVEDSSTDRQILAMYKELFGDFLFDSLVKSSGVVKRWSHTGITTTQGYDKQTMQMYINVVDELLERINREVE